MRNYCNDEFLDRVDELDIEYFFKKSEQIFQQFGHLVPEDQHEKINELIKQKNENILNNKKREQRLLELKKIEEQQKLQE